MSRLKPSKHRRNAKPPKPWFAIITSFILGYLVALVCDFQRLTHLLDPHAVQHTQTAQQPQSHQKPTFEFYTLLSKDPKPAALPHATTTTLLHTQPTPPPPINTIELTKQAPLTALPPPMMPSTQPKVAVNASPHPEPVLRAQLKQDRYFVQMASFNRRIDAEHLKATLILRGFDVGITSIQKANQTWFRVTMGPFASRIQAEHAQKTIEAREHIRGILYKLIA